MSQNEIKVITVQEAKQQINCFGYPLAIFFFLFTFLRFGIAYIPKEYRPQNIELVALAISISSTVLFTIIFMAIAKKKLKLNLKDYWLKSDLPLSRIFSYVILGLGIMLLTNAITSMFSLFTSARITKYAFVGSFRTADNILKNIVYFFFFVILKPITDEIIFRAIVQRQLGHFGRYFGVLASAFLFALIQGNLPSAIPAFFIGWYLSLIALKYHSIRITILSSIFIHLFVWLIDIMPPELILVTTLLVVFIYIMCVVIIVNKSVSTNIIRYGATESKLWKIFLTSPSIILFIIIFIVSQTLFILS